MDQILGSLAAAFVLAFRGATWCQLPPIKYQGEETTIRVLRFANRTLG
jgi:hypothetical protein